MKKTCLMIYVFTTICVSLFSACSISPKADEGDKITKSNIRAAFAEAAAAYLLNGEVNPDGYEIAVEGKSGNGLDISDLNLTCSDKTLLKKLDNKNVAGNKVVVTFECVDGENWIMTAVSNAGYETDKKSEVSSGEKEATKKDPVVSIEETVLYDQNDMKITAKGFDLSGFFGPSLKLLIENNSSKAMTVQPRNVSVNGYMVDAMLSSNVAPGKKANDELVFTQNDLELAGITTIAEMEFSFHFFETESWSNDIDSEMITLKTSAADNYTFTFDDSGEKAYDENGIEIVVKGLAQNDSWLGPEVIVYISNSTDKDITVQTRDVSINGFMIDGIFSCDVVNGKHAVDTIAFLSSDLEKNGIEKIEEIELTFRVIHDWDSSIDTQPVIISFTE